MSQKRLKNAIAQLNNLMNNIEEMTDEEVQDMVESIEIEEEGEEIQEIEFDGTKTRNFHVCPDAIKLFNRYNEEFSEDSVRDRIEILIQMMDGFFENEVSIFSGDRDKDTMDDMTESKDSMERWIKETPELKIEDFGFLDMHVEKTMREFNGEEEEKEEE